MTRRVVAALVLVCFGAACTRGAERPPVSAASGHETPGASVPVLPASIAFRDASRGWAGVPDGILSTSDGGRSWLRQHTGGRVVALDPAGWAADGRRILRLRAGAWQAAGEAPAEVVRVVAVSEAAAWAATSARRLVHTTDAGSSWTDVRDADLLCFAGDGQGWVVTGSTVFRTTDDGRTWRRSLAPKLAGDSSLAGAAIACGPGVAWVLFRDGVAAGSESYAAYRGAGDAWKLVLASNDALPASPRASPKGIIDAYAGPLALAGTHAVFAGSCPACDPQPRPSVTVTRDDGATFEHVVVPAPRGGAPVAIAFTGDDGFLLLETGELWATTDGARTWRRRSVVPGIAAG